MAKTLLSMTMSSPARFAIFLRDEIIRGGIRKSLAPHIGISQVRTLQTTPKLSGLEEFFDDPKNYGETIVKSGRSWRTDELRLKSNNDLHKLWFVLYKERNMLWTMKEAAKEEKEIFPSPERIDKVEDSMRNIEEVVMERNKAYWQLEVSPCITGTRPRVFRRDGLGIPRWQYCSQHLPPYKYNSKWRNLFGPRDVSEVSWFINRYREMTRREHNRRRSRTARYLRDIFRRFPNADAEYIAETHPEFPPGYVEHLKKNHHLYVHDPPRNRRMANVLGACKELERSKEEKLLK